MGAGLLSRVSPVLAVYAVIGLSLGLAYFGLMWRSVRALAGGATGGVTIAAMALRFALLAGALFLASRGRRLGHCWRQPLV